MASSVNIRNSAVYVWHGSQSKAADRKTAQETAVEYISTAPDGRTARTCELLVVQPGHEPPHFAAYFLGWDNEDGAAAAASGAPSGAYKSDLASLVAKERKRERVSSLGSV